MAAFPDHFGVTFTSTTHERAEGPTLPENNKPASGHRFNVVVTGAGKGIGHAISIAYAKAGATGLCISSRTQSDLDKLASELQSINPELKIVNQTCDTTQPEDVQRLAQTVNSAFNGHVDVVIANAGIISKYITDSTDPKTGKQVARRLPVGIIEDEDFARVANINYLGSYYTAKYFTPLLIAKDNPSKIKVFIVITSLAGHFPISDFTPIAYNVSKIANNRMIEMMANDHREDGLVAYAVHPGEVVTPQTQGHSTEKDDAWEKREFLSFSLNITTMMMVCDMRWKT